MDRPYQESSSTSLKGQKNPLDKLSLILQFLSKYISEMLHKDPKLGSENFTVPKALLYQMYFVIAKLDENKLVRMDFLVNFGVSLEIIH